MSKDCKLYENCIDEKKQTFVIENQNESGLLLFAVGCWGVYCNEGEYTKIKKDKSEEVVRGQKTVQKLLMNAATDNKNRYIDMILAGDNVYADLEKDGSYNIGRQIEEGFEKCFKINNIKNYFLAIGNHDIENCDILTTEINYKGWNLPSLYYNIYYTLADFTLNIIVLDTNMFEDEPTQCSKEKFNDKQIEKQIEWAVKTSKNNSTWTIVVGHIPYYACGHKDKNRLIKREKLADLIHDIKPDIYFCADEHNMQCIQDGPTTILVAGSGGTNLDDIITTDCKLEFAIKTFGFVSLDINKNNIKIVFHTSDDKIKFEKIIRKLN